MEVLKPLIGEPLAFWFSGGEILWRGQTAHGAAQIVPIDREALDHLREVYSIEARAYHRAGDLQMSRHAAKLWVQLTHARDAHDTYLRACGRRA